MPRMPNRIGSAVVVPLLRGAWLALLLTVLVAPGMGQVLLRGQVRYGQAAVNDSIGAGLETHRYLMIGDGAGSQAGDVLRITFNSRDACCPYRVHQLDVFSSSLTHLGTITGTGELTVPLSAAAFYVIDVRARNNQSTGWYAFQLERLNPPTRADTIAFNWRVNGDITSAAGFATFLLRADAGVPAQLSFDSRDACCPYYVHQVELLDAAGQAVRGGSGSPLRVDGRGSVSFTFPSSGVYTLFVRARNFESTGWYWVSVACSTAGFAPCVTTPQSANYGHYALGLPGTSGMVPPPCTSNIVPSLVAQPAGTCNTAQVVVGNPFPTATQAFVLVGASAGNTWLPSFGCRLLVANYGPPIAFTLPASGYTLPIQIPCSPFLTGLGFALQAVVADPAAGPPTFGAVFSRGLLMVI